MKNKRNHLQSLKIQKSQNKNDVKSFMFNLL